MSNIFDDDSADSDVEIRTNNEYAKNYNIWRKKEEINKLKTKYGEDVEDLDQESSSSSDDEDGVKVTREIERDFFKTLACLKNKDPRIYNENVNFFQNNDQDSSRHVAEKKKKNKEGPMYLKDYERKIILEKGGVLSDEEDVTRRPRSPTYAEEQEYNRESLKKIVNSVEDDEDSGNELAGMLKPRKKTQEEKNEEEEDYKKWLAGEEAKISKDVERELKPLKEYWNNPDLEEGEMFLRDYILNKKFLEKDDQDYIPTYDEIIHDSDQDLSNDEDTIEKQEAFEHKFNFRFEEPDEEFVIYTVILSGILALWKIR
ncbi:hypothetical protein NQ315_007147 [Exocentrus adspersus]|uniref:Protein KRI1 homolog n=1 Tax=Exocentrus adspersus TaxID=1586481 RepID=A0AAV8WDM0_9CUCU|nr:hypothetical protein NQ315_007147 [Exocentrus adspersus]